MTKHKVTKNWDEIDRIAANEARALGRARKFLSRPARQASKVVTRQQAAFDECLEIHATECYFCGRDLREEPLDQDVPLSKVSIYGQTADICRSCMYLATRVFHGQGFTHTHV